MKKKPDTSKLRDIWNRMEQQQLDESCVGGVCSIKKPADKSGGGSGKKIGKPTSIYGRNVEIDEDGEGGGATDENGTTTHDNALFRGVIGYKGVFAGKNDDVKCPKGTVKKNGACVVKEGEEEQPPEPETEEPKEEKPDEKPKELENKEQDVVQFASDIGYQVEVQYAIVNKNQNMPFDTEFVELANKIQPGSSTPNRISLSHEGWKKLIKVVEEMKKVPPQVPQVPQPTQNPQSIPAPIDNKDKAMVPFPDDFAKPKL